MASDIVAIDVHVHLSDEFTQKAKGSRTAQMAKYFGRERPPVSIDEMADQYRARKMMAVIMNTRDETVTGLTPVPNDHVAGAVKKHPDVFLAFGAIDPWTGRMALDEIRRCKDLGLSGMGELNPARQHFFPTTCAFIRCGKSARNSICRFFFMAAWRRPVRGLRAAWASS